MSCTKISIRFNNHDIGGNNMQDFKEGNLVDFSPYLYIAFYFAIINIIGIIICGIDKYKARRSLWRIPERTFFWLALMGAAPGVYFGFLLFHHKTRHKRFMIGIPVIFIFQVLGLILFYLYLNA